MRKINCYSKYAYVVYFLMLLLTIVIGTLPFILFKEDQSIFRIIWICIIVLCFIISFYGFFHHRQYLYVENGKFILRDCFMKMTELNIEQCYYEISVLPSYFGRVISSETWICIYSIQGKVKKFKYGVSNGRKQNRIQLIYNEKNLEFVNKYIKIFEDMRD